MKVIENVDMTAPYVKFYHTKEKGRSAKLVSIFVPADIREKFAEKFEERLDLKGKPIRPALEAEMKAFLGKHK